MHEGKGLSLSETKMDLGTPPSLGEVGLLGESPLGGTKKGLKLSGLGLRELVTGSSGGSAGDESSSDEPGASRQSPARAHPVHHHALPPKKYRLKDTLNSSILAPLLQVASPRSRDPMKEEEEEMLHIDDCNQDQEDDESSGPSLKESGISHSFTSGENSDSEMGCDGDDMMGLDKGGDSGRKHFECDVCNMKFSNGANMRRHRMRHTGVKPYECRVCQKRFFRKDHLAEHFMAKHGKLLPFRCPICNKGFQRQIAMRAHFQNEHVGGSHDMVKACPLCTYKAGSMKSLRVHIYSRHGIDLDNPMPHSPFKTGSPGPSAAPAEYSELAVALGFEDREKSSDSIPSHFLVPQIEISANSPFPPHFSFTPDSSYAYAQDERQSSNGDSPSPPNVSPQSSDSSSNVPSSSDLVVVKREVVEEEEEPCPEQSEVSPGEPGLKESPEPGDHLQDTPEDLSSSGTNSSRRSTHSPKCSSSSKTKLSPLKSLLRADDWWKEPKHAHNGGSNDKSSSHSSTSKQGSGNTVSVASRPNNTKLGAQGYEGETISSSNGSDTLSRTHSASPHRRGTQLPPPVHQCVYCGIIFPDKTLYFLHKGCHSDSSPWKCNICGEACCNVYDFNSHLLSKSHQ